MFLVFCALPILHANCASTVSTTTESEATQYCFQRMGFYSPTACKYFQTYSSGGAGGYIYYRSSSDNITWSSPTSIVSTNFGVSIFSLYYDVSNDKVHFVWTDYDDITYQRGTPQSNGTITMDVSAQTVETSDINKLEYPTIAVDSNGYPYIGYGRYTQTGYGDPYVTKSSLNNGSWVTASGYPKQMHTLIENRDAISLILPLTSSKMYAVYWHQYETIYGSLFNGTGWESEETITSAYDVVLGLSGVSISDDVYIAFVNYTSCGIKAFNRTYSEGAWGNVENVEPADTGLSYAVLSQDGSNVYCFFWNSSNAVYYKKRVSGVWDSDATTFVADETNLLSTTMTGFFKSYSNKIGVSWVNGTESPYDVRFETLSLGEIPTIAEFESPSTMYAYQEVLLNASVSDGDGNTTLQNATLTLSTDSVVLKWVNSTNTFSMTAPDNKWALVSGARTYVNSTSYKLTWTLKSYWNSTEGYVSISQATVYDEDNNSGSNSESNWFYNENDLIIDSTSVDDSVVNPSDSLAFNGQIYYQSTSTAPYTTTGITANIELASVLKGSNSSIASDGSFTISFNAESTFSNHSYNTYCTTTKNGVQNKTVYVVVERVNVTISANTTSPWIDDTARFTVTAVYEYYGTTVISWTVNINRNDTHFASGNFTDTQATEIIYQYTTENVTETLYGLTTFTSNTETVTWVGRYSLNFQARDYEDNILTEAVIYIDNGTEYSQTVNSQGWANWTNISSDTVDVHATWYGYTVNSTFQITLDADQTLNVTCNCYPFTLDSTTYWIAGNATVDTYSWNSTTKKFVITFTGAETTYTLKSSTTSYPTYVLNCTYDTDTDWSTYLTLTHYGNHTITIAYPNWASTRVYRTDDLITNSYWASEGEIMYVLLSGSSGENGTLEVYCGSRGTPQSTNGLSDTVYFSGTTILAGTYSFSSTVTVEIDWTTESGGSSGGRSISNIFLSAETTDLGSIQQGVSKNVNATASWSGSATITIVDVSFSGDGAEWLKCQLSLPQTVERLAIETEGTINVPIALTIPSQAKLDSYRVLVEYKIQVGRSMYQTTANLLFNTVATPVPSEGIPALMTLLLFGCLIAAVFIGIKKR